MDGDDRDLLDVVGRQRQKCIIDSLKAASNEDFVFIFLDATSALYQAPIVAPTVVRPPHGEAASGILWKLNKAMPGLRASAKAWDCLVYISPSPRDRIRSRMPFSA